MAYAMRNDEMILFPPFSLPRQPKTILPISGGGTEPTFVVLCRLEQDGCLRAMFERLGLPLEKMAFTDAKINAFAGEHSSALLEEECATLLLRMSEDGLLDVVRLEREPSGRVDKHRFSIDLSWIWRASDGHQIVIPAQVLEQ